MQSDTFGLKLAGFFVFALVIAAPLLWQSCRGGAAAAEVPTTEQLRESLQAAIADFALCTKILDPIGRGPWAARGQLASVANLEKNHLKSRALSIRPVDEAIEADPDESQRRSLATQVQRLADEFAAYRARIEPFRTQWDADLTDVSETFLLARQLNETMGRLQESRVDTSRHALTMRTLTRSIEDGARFWSDSMAARLRPPEDMKERTRLAGLRELGLGSLRASRVELDALREPLLRAGLANSRLRNTIVSTRRALKKAAEDPARATRAQSLLKRLDDEILPRLQPHRSRLLDPRDPARDDAIEAALREIAGLPKAL